MKLSELINRGLSVYEAVAYNLVKSGMTYREIGERLGASHTAVQNWYKAGEEKL